MLVELFSEIVMAVRGFKTLLGSVAETQHRQGLRLDHMEKLALLTRAEVGDLKASFAELRDQVAKVLERAETLNSTEAHKLYQRMSEAAERLGSMGKGF